MIDLLWDSESLAAPTPPAPAAPVPTARVPTAPVPTAPMELAEVRLVAELRRGDSAAFEALYRREVRGLYGLALRLSSRAAEAEELTQEVFVRAWEARASFTSLAHFRNWLRRVAVNEWINRTRRVRPLALDEEVSAAATATATPASRAAGARIDLERALANLSPRLRAVLILFDLYGLDHAEIGELLGMTVGASKVQLFRARRRLRELLS